MALQDYKYTTLTPEQVEKLNKAAYFTQNDPSQFIAVLDSILGGISGGGGGGGVTSVAGLTGAITASQLKTALAINNVDNTSDLNKPISTATQAALDLKADATALSTKADTSALADLVSNTELTSTLTDYAKTTVLSDYATTTALNSAVADLASNSDVNSAITGVVGSLSTLTTTDKTSVVAAINEVKSEVTP